MPKNFFEDMVRIKREQRGDFRPVSDTGSEMPPAFAAPRPSMQEERRVPKPQAPRAESQFASVYDVADTGGKTTSKYGMWIIACVSVLFLLFALSYLFASAKVSITPKVQAITVNENLTAAKDAGGDALAFDLVVLSGDETKSVQGGAEEDVFKRSKGKVIIYNDYSTTAQNLDIDTRLEGSNGKIYKTSTKTTVPGKSKTGTPGSVEVAVYASEPGAEYDSGPLDFKIFGFKGTPKYEKFYARSKDPIAGGFKGKTKTVSQADRDAAIAELKNTLQAKLLQKATDQIPAGFILFKDAGFLQTQEPSADTAALADGSVPITLTGTFYGVLFDEQKLTKKLAQDSIASYDGADIYIPHMTDLGFSVANQDTLSKDTKNISFTVSGDAKVVWKVDTEKFASDVLGAAKSKFNEILATYPNIDSATLTIRPLWKMSFPDKTKDIQITVVESQ